MPLKETSDSYLYSDSDTLIIDFVSSTNNQGIKDGTLDFVSSRAIERMNIGYMVAKNLLDKLIKERVIAIKWYQKIMLGFKRFSKNKRDNYYFLSKEEIEKLINNEHM